MWAVAELRIRWVAEALSRGAVVADDRCVATGLLAEWWSRILTTPSACGAGRSPLSPAGADGPESVQSTPADPAPPTRPPLGTVGRRSIAESTTGIMHSLS